MFFRNLDTLEKIRLVMYLMKQFVEHQYTHNQKRVMGEIMIDLLVDIQNDWIEKTTIHKQEKDANDIPF